YEDKDYLYISMEFVADGDLCAYIKARGSSPPLEETCQAISRQMLEALEVLHERQVCHRDLKPQNILVAALDPIRVKMTDFGASKYLEGTECRTRIGASGYAAPKIEGV
ncbi:kinase-like domain-containing protein, partial [Morchella snyderi]